MLRIYFNLSEIIFDPFWAQNLSSLLPSPREPFKWDTVSLARGKWRIRAGFLVSKSLTLPSAQLGQDIKKKNMNESWRTINLYCGLLFVFMNILQYFRIIKTIIVDPLCFSYITRVTKQDPFELICMTLHVTNRFMIICSKLMQTQSIMRLLSIINHLDWCNATRKGYDFCSLCINIYIYIPS